MCISAQQVFLQTQTPKYVFISGYCTRYNITMIVSTCQMLLSTLISLKKKKKKPGQLCFAEEKTEAEKSGTEAQ
jgi:hypothetical protein